MARPIASKAQSLTLTTGSGPFRLLVAEAEAVLDADDQSRARPEDDALRPFAEGDPEGRAAPAREIDGDAVLLAELEAE